MGFFELLHISGILQASAPFTGGVVSRFLANSSWHPPTSIPYFLEVRFFSLGLR